MPEAATAVCPLPLHRPSQIHELRCDERLDSGYYNTQPRSHRDQRKKSKRRRRRNTRKADPRQQQGSSSDDGYTMSEWSDYYSARKNLRRRRPAMPLPTSEFPMDNSPHALMWNPSGWNDSFYSSYNEQEEQRGSPAQNFRNTGALARQGPCSEADEIPVLTMSFEQEQREELWELSRGPRWYQAEYWKGFLEKNCCLPKQQKEQRRGGFEETRKNVADEIQYPYYYYQEYPSAANDNGFHHVSPLTEASQGFGFSRSSWQMNGSELMQQMPPHNKFSQEYYYYGENQEYSHELGSAEWRSPRESNARKTSTRSSHQKGRDTADLSRTFHPVMSMLARRRLTVISGGTTV
jgi:hypothetical protein